MSIKYTKPSPSGLADKVIPMLQKYPLQGEKLLDYFDFRFLK